MHPCDEGMSGNLEKISFFLIGALPRNCAGFFALHLEVTHITLRAIALEGK